MNRLPGVLGERGQARLRAGGALRDHVLGRADERGQVTLGGLQVGLRGLAVLRRLLDERSLQVLRLGHRVGNERLRLLGSLGRGLGDGLLQYAGAFEGFVHEIVVHGSSLDV